MLKKKIYDWETQILESKWIKRKGGSFILIQLIGLILSYSFSLTFKIFLSSKTP